jgi:hypothetical protein
MTEIAETRNLVLLGYLEEIFVDLGYEDAQVIEPSAQVALPSLLVSLEADKKGRARFLTLMFYPVAEMEDTLLLQYYVELPFQVAAVPAVNTLLPVLNHRAVVGYFGLDGNAKPYYRYVQALRADARPTAKDVADVTALIVTTTDLLQAVFEEVASGTTSLDDARSRIDRLLLS